MSTLDPLPNFICQICWAIIDAFHELYQKSKLAAEKFCNPIIKTDLDVDEEWPNYNTNQFATIEVGPIKLEQESGR